MIPTPCMFLTGQKEETSSTVTSSSHLIDIHRCGFPSFFSVQRLLGRHSFRPRTNVLKLALFRSKACLSNKVRWFTALGFRYLMEFTVKNRMSPYTVTSSSTSSSSSTPTASSLSDPTPKNDHRLLAVIIVLTIVAAFLITYIMYITVRLKKRQENGEIHGPNQGTVIHDDDHPAANITPFGAVGPNAGGKVPRFSESQAHTT